MQQIKAIPARTRRRRFLPPSLPRPAPRATRPREAAAWPGPPPAARAEVATLEKLVGPRRRGRVRPRLGPAGEGGSAPPPPAPGAVGVFPGSRAPPPFLPPTPPGRWARRPRGSVLGCIVPWAGDLRGLDPLREEAVGPGQTPECTPTKNKWAASPSLFAGLESGISGFPSPRSPAASSRG